MTNETRRVGYGWEDIESGNFTNYMVLDGAVLNMNPYLKANPSPIPGDVVDLAIREQLASSITGGRDSTMMFYTNPTARKAIKCLVQKYDAGHIDKITPGCFISNLVLYCSLVVILAIVLIRFFMAVFFSWFMAGRMASTPRPSRHRKIAPNVLPDGAMVSVNSSGAAPWANKQRPPPSQPMRRKRDSTASATPSVRTACRSSTSAPSLLSSVSSPHTPKMRTASRPHSPRSPRPNTRTSASSCSSSLTAWSRDPESR